MPKTILVTGAGRGLGRFLTEALVRDGHHVIATARAPGLADQIRAAMPSARIDEYVLDLASFASIRAFAGALGAPLKLDVLFHVAGVMQQSPTRRLTIDGVEETLAVNAFAPFLLTHELMPRLGTGRHLPRVVCVSSRLHLPGSRGTPVRFDFSDPNLDRDYHPDRAYKNSKLALLWFTYELARRFPPPTLTAHAVCPGFVPTTAAASTHGMQRLLLKYVLPLMPFATSVNTAVSALRKMAVDPALDASTGDFWADDKPAESSKQSHDEADARAFWTLAERVTAART